LRFDAGAKVTLKFENFVYKFVFLVVFFMLVYLPLQWKMHEEHCSFY